MKAKHQFSLRTMAFFVAALCIVMALFRVMAIEWRIAFAVGLTASLIAVLGLTLSSESRPIFRRLVLTTICLASSWMIAMGFYPTMYYLTGWFFVVLLWGGVLIGCCLLSLASMPQTEIVLPRSLKPTEWALVTIPMVATLLLAFQLPMRLAATQVIPKLQSQLVAGPNTPTLFASGLYTFRAPSTRSAAPQAVYFQMAHDGESAFVYSPNGIDAIAYNSGSKGRLYGDWYWISED